MVTWHRKPLKDLVDRCFRCGLCRAVCPVFLQDGREPTVARAKLQLIAALSGGGLRPGGRLAYLLSRCLVCGACETICPADTAVTEAVLRARGELAAALDLGDTKAGQAGPGPKTGRLDRTAADDPTPAAGILNGAARTEAVLSRWRRYLQILRGRPERPLAAVLGLLSGRPTGGLAGDGRQAGDAAATTGADAVAGTTTTGRSGAGHDADDAGHADTGRDAETAGLPRATGPADARMKVGYFPGCADLLWPRLWSSTFELFRRSGVRAVVPAESFCCGHPFLEAGDPGPARQLVNENIKAFERMEVEAIVAGCSTGARMLGQYAGEILGLTGFPVPVHEMGEFLIRMAGEGTLPELNTPVPVRIAYLPPRGLGRPADGALELLGRVPQLEPVVLADDQGCGGSLFFAALHPEQHERIIGRAIEAAVDRGCRAVVAHNPLTMYLLDAYLEKHRIDLRVVHLAEILAMACKKS